MPGSCDVFICGAGIAGVSTAYQLSVKHGIKNIYLVDERPPLTLTSDSSTECYRNWWPGPGSAMVALMNRSIDLLEELAVISGDVFHLNRRGYLYLTGNAEKIPSFIDAARQISELGGGPLRFHYGTNSGSLYEPSAAEGWENQPVGADLLLDPSLIQNHFPYVGETTVAALHVRRAGWFSAQQLGMYLLEQARLHGVKLVQARVTGVEVTSGKIASVRLDNNETIFTDTFINASGPFQQDVAALLGIDLPVFAEFHQKVAFRDTLAVLDRDAPLLIWTDPQYLDWSPEEASMLAEEPEFRWLLDLLPSGVHTRPEGGSASSTMLMLWEYHTEQLVPTWPLPFDPQYPEIVLRGMMTMLPGLRNYIGRLPKPVLDGGYYLKTRENRPIIGPMGINGAYIMGGLSGFGIMAACGASELLAAHITGSHLPSYSQDFSLDRYQDPNYLKKIESFESSGQL